jgi:hypothetical protein
MCPATIIPLGSIPLEKSGWCRCQPCRLVVVSPLHSEPSLVTAIPCTPYAASSLQVYSPSFPIPWHARAPRCGDHRSVHVDSLHLPLCCCVCWRNQEMLMIIERPQTSSCPKTCTSTFPHTLVHSRPVVTARHPDPVTRTHPTPLSCRFGRALRASLALELSSTCSRAAPRPGRTPSSMPCRRLFIEHLADEHDPSRHVDSLALPTPASLQTSAPRSGHAAPPPSPAS